MTPAGGQTLGTFGFAKLNGTVVVLRPGADQDFPLNPDIPPPINGYGGYGAMNYEEGMQFPQWSLPVVLLDTGAANWFTAANLNSWFLTRSSRPVWDLTALTSFLYSENGSIGDGQGTWAGDGVKGAGFTLVGRSGQGIAMTMSFVGKDATPSTSSGDLPTTGLAGTPLSFDRINLGSATAFDQVGTLGFTLQYSTGANPNMELNGTKRPTEINGGTPSCVLTVEFNALNGTPPPGWDVATNAPEELTDVPLVVKAVDLGGVGDVDITFTLKRLRIRNPRNRRGTAGRAQRTFVYDCLAAINSQPLVIS